MKEYIGYLAIGFIGGVLLFLVPDFIIGDFGLIWSNYLVKFLPADFAYSGLLTFFIVDIPYALILGLILTIAYAIFIRKKSDNFRILISSFALFSFGSYIAFILIWLYALSTALSHFSPL